MDRDKNNLIDLAERREARDAARREREQAARNDENYRHLIAPLFPDGHDAA